MARLLCLIIGYAFGNIQTSYIYGRMHNIDIRQHGSGNAGTTNALRVLGWKAGLVVFFGDFLKTVAAALIVRLLLGNTYHELISLLVLYSGLGVVLGHNYPFYLGFKGGKGIASMAGILMSFDFRITLVCLLVFLITVAVTRYVSLGSLLVVTCFFLLVLLFGSRGDYGLQGARLYEMYGLAFVLMALPIYKHRANVKRLLNGTENKLGAKKE